MVYTPPVTKAADTVITAAVWNAEVTENFKVMVPDIFTAKGELIIGTGVDTAALLSVGTDGKYLTSDSAEAKGVKWGSFTAPVFARARISAKKTLAVNANNIIDFDSVISDSGSTITVGDSWKFTPPHDGDYLISTNVRFWLDTEIFFDSNDTGGDYREVSYRYTGTQYAALDLFKNGSYYLRLFEYWHVDGDTNDTVIPQQGYTGTPPVMGHAVPIYLEDSDYISIVTSYYPGTPDTTGADTTNPQDTIAYLYPPEDNYIEIVEIF